MNPMRARVVEEDKRGSDPASESSSEEEEQEEEEQEDEEGEEVAEDEATVMHKIRINLKDVCKVCGKPGHKAGFVGAVYVDCINKPCYLCKKPGHTTATCPYKIQPGHGTLPSHSTGGTPNAVRLVRQLEAGLRSPTALANVPQHCPKFQVEAAILRLHSRRVCCLEFHHRQDALVMSGDKKGGVALWDMQKVHERTHFPDTHKYLVNSIKFLPWLEDAACATSSCDGTAKVLDIETGISRTLVDLNPNGYTSEKEWKMVYGADTSPGLRAVVVGDSDGCVHILDPRTQGPVSSLQLHKRANKVVSVAVHPLEPRLLLTAGNDHTARMFDMRVLSNFDCNGTGPGAGSGLEAGSGAASASRPSQGRSGSGGEASTSQPTLTGGAGSGGARGKSGSGRGKGGGAPGSHPAELFVLKHPRVVNSAFFSPLTGRKLLTTCQDNRLRVWDNVLLDIEPREIVHSHDFNRYLTAFKAEWDPKDMTESRCVIGRYISEEFGGVALHPIDIIDTRSGALLASLIDHNLTTISPVNKPHPRRDMIVTGSSRSLYLWSAVSEEQERGEQARESPAGDGAGPSAGGLAQGLRDMLHSASQHSRYTFFDADPETKKKGGRGKGKGKRPAMDDDDDD